MYLPEKNATVETPYYPMAEVPRPRGVANLRPAAPSAPMLAAAPNVVSLLRALRRRWLSALAVGLPLALLVAAVVWFFLPPARNSANVLLHISANDQGIIGPHPDPVGQFDNYQSTQAALVKSRLVLNAAIRPHKVAELNMVREVLDPIEWLEKEVRVDFPSGKEILRITMWGDDIEELKTLTNSIADAYLMEIVEKQKHQRNKRLEELKGIRAKFKDQMDLQRKFQEDLGKHVGAASSTQLGLVSVMLRDQHQEIRQQLIKTRTELRQKEITAELAAASERTGKEVRVPTKLIDSQLALEPSLEPHLKKINDLQSKIEANAAAARGGESDPIVQKMQKELEAEKALYEARGGVLRQKVEARLRERMREESGINLQGLQSQIAFYKAMEKQQTEELAKVAKAIEEAPGGQVNLQKLQFDVEQSEEMVKSVSKAITQLEVEIDAPARVTRLQDAVGQRVDNVVRKATAAGTSAIAILGMVLFGVAFVEFRSRRIDTVEEVSTGLGVRIVGTVPACPAGTRPDALSAARWKGMLTESVDAARTLLLNLARRDDLRVVMVTSANSGEGKTSVSTHLAVSMARAGRRTLLIDCDLRNPSTHTLFNLPVGPGLSEVLRGEAEATTVLRPTPAAGLWLMPAGACDGAALAMLAQDGLQPIFERFRREFDFVVVDSSPVLPVADSLIVAQQVDGVVFAVLREVSRFPKVQEAYQKICSLGVRVIGAIVNGTSGEVYGYGYNDRYIPVVKKG